MDSIIHGSSTFLSQFHNISKKLIIFIFCPKKEIIYLRKHFFTFDYYVIKIKTLIKITTNNMMKTSFNRNILFSQTIIPPLMDVSFILKFINYLNLSLSMRWRKCLGYRDRTIDNRVIFTTNYMCKFLSLRYQIHAFPLWSKQWPSEVLGCLKER